MNKVIMKAGEYYIGDSCYVLKEGQHPGFDWANDFCEKFFEEDGGKFEVLGKEVVAFSTSYGDDCYLSNVGFEFPVDAGLIGCTPADLWKGVEEPFGCLKVSFKEDFVCYEDDGYIVFGHIEIDTKQEEDHTEWQF